MIGGLEQENNILSSIMEKSYESVSFLFDISGGANAVVDSSGRIIIANSSFFRMFNIDYILIGSGIFLNDYFDSRENTSIRFFLNERIFDPYNSPKTSIFNIKIGNNDRKKVLITAVRIPGTSNILISATQTDSFYVKSSMAEAVEKKEISPPFLTEENTNLKNFSGGENSSLNLVEKKGEKIESKDGNLKNYQLSLLNEILIKANSSFLLSNMLDNILRIISERLDFEICFIYLKGHSGKTAEIVSAVDVPRSFVESRKVIDVRSWPNNLVFYAGQSKYVENVPGVNISRYDINVLESLGALSYAAIPLISENTVIGALFVARAYEGSFKVFEKETLELIGREVSTIILRGLLQEKLEKECSEAKQCFGIVLDDISDLNEDLMHYVDKINGKNNAFSHLVDRMSSDIRENRLILDNLRIIKEIREEFCKELNEVSLDSTIKEIIYKYPKMNINYHDSDIFIYSDEYIGALFLNLFDYLIKMTDNRSKIFVKSVSSSGEIKILIEITGSGLSDGEKMLLFSDFDEENLHLDSNSLGLYIVYILVKRYEGEIGVTDRIPGDPSKGLSFKINFPGCSRKTDNT